VYAKLSNTQHPRITPNTRALILDLSSSQGNIRMASPARRLLGMTLSGGWRVLREIQLGTGSTGATFSAGYIVERQGQSAYLKALDYSSATRPGRDTLMELQRMTTEYLFERDLVLRCAGKGFNRIVKGIDHGKVVVAPGLDGQVEYIIFELAEGDIRRQLAKARAIDLAWVLRVLHHVATGLFQLHNASIAHQDVKPSNVLGFEVGGWKLTDLGRAASQGVTTPHDGYPVAGDPIYAPPELLYGEVSIDWHQRRVACDLFHLGSLAVFLFSNANMTHLLFSEMPREQLPDKWKGSYRDVLPYVRDAFGRAIERFSVSVPSPVRTEMVAAVRQLCEPDPNLRGHPRDRTSVHNRYTCQRYMSLFNLLAARAEYGRFPLSP
jgi:serine/threonine protein kinase